MKEDDKIIPIKKEEKKADTPTSSLSEPAEQTIDPFVRSLIPIDVSTVGRSIKLRDIFTTSGVVACDSTVATVTSDGSGGNETDLKSFTFFANEWHVGMCVRIIANGLITTSGGGAGPVCIIRLGSGLAPTTEWAGATSTAAIMTNEPWNFEFYGTVISIGSAGTLERHLKARINNINKDFSTPGTPAIVTTAPITVALTADWSVATAGNSISVRQWIVEVLY